MYFFNTACLIIICLLLTCKNGQSAVTCEYIEAVLGGKEDTERVLRDPAKSQYCVRADGTSAFNSTELRLKDTRFRVLGQYSIRNLPWLTQLSCNFCKVTRIAPGAFVNVPNITKLDFSYSNLTVVRRGTFDVLPNLKILDLRRNKIYNIDDQAFGNLPALSYINLDNNDMEYWKAEWFTNTSSVVTVTFIKNQLRSIRPFAFTGFSNIQNIHFDGNKIRVIHEDAFKGITSLNILGLSNNRLTTLSEFMFPDNIRIAIFDISGNELNFIPNVALKKLTTDMIYLEANPWKCPCLNQIASWLDFTVGKTKSTREDPVCNGPNLPVCASTGGTCSESVDSEITKQYNSHPEVVKRKANILCDEGYNALLFNLRG